MGLMTLEGVVKNGQIRLKSGINLPENAKVYIIFPEIPSSQSTEEDSQQGIEISDEWSDEDLAEFSQTSMAHAAATILLRENEGD